MASFTGAEDFALAAIVRSSGDAVIGKTIDGVITSWNAGATAIYGYSPQEMIGASFERMIPPELLDLERKRHAGVAAGHSESGYACERLHADGTRLQLVMSMSPVRDENGELTGVASLSRPRSQREREDARFSSLLDAAPDAMLCVNRDGEIVFANSQASAVFGFAHDELLGQPLEVLLPESVRVRHVAHRERFFQTPQRRPMGSGIQLYGRRRDGSTFPVDVSLASDRIYGELLVIAAVRDVSVARAKDAALRESEARLLQLTENVATVFTLRRMHPPEYLYVSPSVRELTGHDPQAFLANPALLEELVHPDDVARVADTVLSVDPDGPAKTCEYRIVRSDGAIRWVRAVATPVEGLSGDAGRVVTTTEDITERVEALKGLEHAEAAARAANEAKNAFLSRMSHELRTPLNAVIGFSQLLERRLSDSQHIDSARYILRAGRHLLDLINEVLDIARIESGEMSLSPEPVSVAAIIDETATLMQPLADELAVTLTVAGGPAGRFVLADRQRLRQILLNLISNAIKYNRPQGCVWLSWSGTDGKTAVSVRDDGPGVAPEMHDRLFAPFDRLGAEVSSVEGTGVGLTVSRGLVELMNGTIAVDSQVGSGAEFIVSLPSANEPQARIGHQDPVVHLPEVSEPAATGTSTVLYIEDNEPNVRVMESLLELRPSWRLIHAGMSRLGLEIARAHQPDLVLLDLHLPDGSGFDVLAAMKRDARLADIPVVVLSADASPNQVRRLLAAGATKYLTKPLDLDEVLLLLDDAESKPTSGAGPPSDVS